MTTDDLSNAVLIRVREDLQNPNVRRLEHVVLKPGPRAYKVAALLYFGPPGTNDVSKTTLSCRTYKRHKVPGAGYAFDDPSHSWSCDDVEVERLKRFLNAELGEPGEYEVVARQSAIGALLDAVHSGNVEAESLVDLVRALADSEAAMEAIHSTPAAALLSAAVELRRHNQVYNDLRRLVDDPRTTEPQLQDLLEREWWLFGGRYVARLDRSYPAWRQPFRRLTWAFCCVDTV